MSAILRGVLKTPPSDYAVPRQTAVTANFSNEQLLLFVFAVKHRAWHFSFSCPIQLSRRWTQWTLPVGLAML